MPWRDTRADTDSFETRCIRWHFEHFPRCPRSDRTTMEIFPHNYENKYNQLVRKNQRRKVQSGNFQNKNAGLEPSSYHCQIPGCNAANYPGNIPWDGDTEKSCSFYKAAPANDTDDACIQ